MSQRIAYPDNPIMAAMWAGLVRYVASREDFIAHFEEVSGRKWIFQAGRSPIERMVDHATGHDQAVIDAFIDYVNEYHWGEDPFAETGVRALAEKEPRP